MTQTKIANPEPRRKFQNFGSRPKHHRDLLLEKAFLCCFSKIWKFESHRMSAIFRNTSRPRRWNSEFTSRLRLSKTFSMRINFGRNFSLRCWILAELQQNYENSAKFEFEWSLISNLSWNSEKCYAVNLGRESSDRNFDEVCVCSIRWVNPKTWRWLLDWISYPRYLAWEPARWLFWGTCTPRLKF